MSPDTEEALSQQKRKPSFRIDPEELRQLDRKLSLKIVEIERRKSSAGIESEELDSKVLFPFDRDYIQEGHKTIRGDTPTSIPDDRLCSTDDFSCDFEEETIPVPDIITTHKPFHQRMSSLEECDESKVNENFDAEVIKDESFEENECEFKSFSESGSSEENYGQESSHIDTKFNFDELFLDDNPQKTGYCSDKSIVSISNDNKILDFDFTCADKSLDMQNSKNHSLTSDISTFQSISPNTSTENKQDTEIGLELLSSEKLLNNISETTLTPINLIPTNSMARDCLKETQSYIIEQDSPDCGSLKRSIIEINSVQKELCYEEETNSTAVILEAVSNFEGSELADKKEFGPETEMAKDKVNSISDTTKASIINTTPSRLKYSQENLEKKLANLLPSIPIYSSLDTKIPDVAAVSSRDEEINLIRRKYAHFSYGSTDSNTSEPLNSEGFQGTVPNNVLDGSLIKPKPLQNELDLSFLEIKEGSTSFSDDKHKSSFSLQNQETTDSSVLKTISEKGLTLADPIIQNIIDTDNSFHHSAKSETLKNNSMIDENIEKEPQKSTESLTTVGSHKYTDFQTPKDPENPSVGCKFEKSQSKSLSSSPKRRGSEVALNLILKENSQILSKIHHQSRRNSELSGDSVFKKEQNKHDNQKNQENCDILTIKLDEETMSLKKGFTNNLCDAAGTLNLTQTLNESSNNVNLTNSINKNATKTSSNFCETNGISLIKQSREDKIQTIEANDVNQDIFCTPFEITNTCLDKYQTNEETSLPDVCKLEGSMNNISKYDSNIEESIIKNFKDTSDTCTSSEQHFLKDDSVTEVTPKGFVNKGFIETYRYALGSSKKPSTIDSSLHSSGFSFESPCIDEKLLDTSPIPSEDYKREIRMTDSFKACRDNDDIASTKCFTDTLSETNNDDILKELQALDIKPEDTVSYSGSKNGPPSSIYTKDSCSYRGKYVTEKMSSTYLPSDRRFSFVDSKNESDDFFSEMRTSQKFIQNHFRDNRAVSLDNCTGREMSTMFSEDTCKSLFVRSATVVEDDDSLYMNSYKSHGRLLIEKGELDTFQSLNKESKSLNEKSSISKKPIDLFDRSAYELKETSSVSTHSSFSQFLPRDSNLPELSERDKTDHSSSFRSKDLRSVSPDHYRFPSASPVRKRLDPLHIEPSSSNSASIRNKSPSPQHTSKRKESSFKSFDDYLSDYSYRDATDFKKYHSRTESLDFETRKSDRPSLHQRKRADSYDISSTDKISQDQKSPPTSPLKFNPFPIRSSSRQPKELGIKLGLYLPQKSEKSPSKRLT